MVFNMLIEWIANGVQRFRSFLLVSAPLPSILANFKHV
jgi:hypothetical protein